jgi:hypothetical protein
MAGDPQCYLIDSTFREMTAQELLQYRASTSPRRAPVAVENRLYSELIQEGRLVREQMAYFDRLRAMRIPANEGLALLDLAPDVPPSAEDVLTKARHASSLHVTRRP